MEKAVTILNNKGQKLAADIGEVAGSKKLAVLLPGFLDSKDYGGIAGLAKDLQAVGFTTIRFDATGTWASEGDISGYSLTQRLADLDCVIEFMKKNYGIESVLLAGHSMGGRTSMLCADRHPEVVGLVSIMGSAGTGLKWEKDKPYVSRRDLPSNPAELITFSVPYSFAVDGLQYDPVAAISRLHIPILFIAGGEDTIVTPEKIEVGYKAANEPKKFVVIPSIGNDYRKNPEEVKLVNKEVLQFLEEYSL